MAAPLPTFPQRRSRSMEALRATLNPPMWTDADTLATTDDAALRLNIEWRHRSIEEDEGAIDNLKRAIAFHEHAIRIMARELGLRGIERRRNQWTGTKLGMCVTLLQSYLEVMRLLPATAVRILRHKAEIERTYDGVVRMLTIRQDGQVVGHDLNLCTSDPRTWNVLFLN